jgi:hypothetical protein
MTFNTFQNRFVRHKPDAKLTGYFGSDNSARISLAIIFARTSIRFHE